MHRSAIATAASFVVAFGFVTSVGAQSVRSASFVANCSLSGDADRVFCETRTVALAPSANLRIDGRQNGGITVHAWDNSQFQVVAMVQAHSDTPADAQAIAGGINVTANDGEIRADGPSTNGNRESWSVSYEVWAPRHTALSLVAMNGGISVDGMDAAMTMETMNGGLSLAGVDGDVHATTTNGGITVDLLSDRWHGNGLAMQTTNGSIRISMPASYSAHVETSTVNGSVDLGFPVTVQGRLSRRQLSADVGAGGATISAITTNGSVSVARK